LSLLPGGLPVPRVFFFFFFEFSEYLFDAGKREEVTQAKGLG